MNKLFFIGIATLLFACNPNEKNKETTKSITTDSTIFYPYTYYIKTEADSLLKAKKSLLGTITDSSGNKKLQVIDSGNFKNIVNQFVTKDITDASLKKYFQETVFRDLTTNSIVMTYSTKSDKSTIKNVDVYLDEFKVDDDIASFVNSNDVAMIKVYPPLSGGPTGNGTIAIYTKRGAYSNNMSRRYNFLVKGYTPLITTWQ